MEPHADAKFKRESQGHSDKCGTQHKSVQMTGEKQSQMDRPRTARRPQARPCRPARVRPTVDATPQACKPVSMLPRTPPRALSKHPEDPLRLPSPALTLGPSALFALP